MDCTKKTDEQLVKIARTQNKEFYAELVNRYQNKLFRYIRYLIKDPHKAEDVLQETFIKAFINLNGFNTKRKFSSWIYRIAHNEAINTIKKYKKEVFLTEKGWLKIQPKSNQNLEKETSDKETAIMVRKYLKQLPIKYREPLVLYSLEEKSYKEISNILRLSIGGVSSRINRAKIMLKSIIKNNVKLDKFQNID